MIYGELDEELRSYVRGISRALARGDRHLAEDLEQETFVAALQGRPRDPRATRAWLRGITRNCLRSLRSRTARRPRSVAYAAGVHDDPELARFGTDDAVDPSRDLQREELKGALESALEQLPEAYAEVITLRVVDGLPPREIGAALGIPVETVRTRTRRGFERLKAEVERRNVDAEALSDPRPLFSIAALLGTPRRRLASLTAVAVPAVATVALLTRPAEESAPTVTGRTAPEATVADAAEAAIALPTATRTSTTVPTVQPAATAVALTVRITGPRADEGLDVHLIGPVDDAPFAWTARDGVPHPIDSLEPGRWTLVDETGLVLDERVLEPGPFTWDVALGGPPDVEITVTGPDGKPAAGAELFQRFGLDGAAELVATTDAGGRAVVPLVTGAQWVAARGDVGQRSEAILLAQPLVTGTMSVDLTLVDHAVQWTEVVGAEPFGWTALELVCAPVDRRECCTRSPRGGVRGLASWVPAWTEGDRRFAVIRGNARKHLCVIGDGDIVWTSPEVRRQDAIPARLEMLPPWRVVGRLLSAEGRPVAGRPIRSQPSERARMSGGSAVTDADGRFEIRMISCRSLSLTCNGRAFASAERPERGDLVDVGEVRSAALFHEVSLAGRVTGVAPPFIVHGITRDDVRTPPAVELATASTRSFQTVRDASAAFDLETAPEKVLGIVVTPVAGAQNFAPAYFERPAHGWPKEPLTLEVEPSLEFARIVGRFDPDLLPARARFLDLGTGWRRTIEVPAGDGSFVSPPLGAGLWSVSLQDRRGGFAECGRVQVEAGQRADLGDLAPRVGRIQMSWPAHLASAPPAASGLLIVSAGEEILYRTDVTRAELEGDLHQLDVPAGRHRVSFYVGGEALMTRCDVPAGGIVPARLGRGRAALRLQLPELAPQDGVRVEAISPDGTLIDSLELSRDELSAPRWTHELVAPASRALTLRCTATEGVYTADVEAAGSSIRRIALTPERGARFEPAR